MSGESPVIRKRRVPSRRRRDGLIRFAKDITSQNGEDGIIERLFQLIPQKNDTRCCVDVGAWDGLHLSNTNSLLVHHKWCGVLIEADQAKFNDLQRLHDPLGNTCIHATVSCQQESPNSLVRLIQDCNLPMEFDFLCIDVDGSDYWILHDLWKEQYRPMVVCVEFNPTMPNDLVYIPVRSDVVRHGASLAALCELAEANKYILVETTLYNAFFVPQDIYSDYLQDEVPNTSIEALHETTMGTSLYQLFDGTLKLTGCRKLLWHRLAIDEDSIQVLPKQKRTFPFAPLPPENADLRAQAIDMSSYCRDSTSTDDLESCAKALWGQLKQDGFALVCGTGISRQQGHTALQMTNDFLQEADESVRRSCLTKDRARRGYSPMCTENFASLIGAQGPNDLVRKFRMGPVNSDTHSSPLLRSNVWPTNEWNKSQEFQSSMESYYEASCKAAHAIVRAICDGVLLEHPNIKDSIHILQKDHGVAHTSILTLLNYQSGTRHRRKEKPPLVAPHTDVGVITFLLFDNGGCATLQRAGPDGSWVDVILPESVGEDPIFVVNIADCLSELSGGSLPSTLHRVVPRTKDPTPRNCLALFVGLEPSETLLLPDGETLSYEEWRRRRIARAQAVRLQSAPDKSTS